MTDLTTATRRLITDLDEARTFLQAAATQARVGFDAETSGLDYPTAQIAGFSVYNPSTNDAAYLPVGHTLEDGTPQPYNLPFAALKPDLQRLMESARLTMHNGAYDMLFFIRQGLKFYRTADTHTLASMMQIQSLALKSLVLEYRLAAFSDILSYRKLIAAVRQIPESMLDAKDDEDELNAKFSFTTIDVAEHPRAVQYACDDAVYAYHLFTKLREQYALEIGSEDMADTILYAQFDANALLAESSAHGYLIDPQTLSDFVTDFTKSVEEQERELRTDIATALGWTLPGANPAVTTSVKTASALPSLFD